MRKVVNRDATIAVSYNFLDDYSIGAYAQLLMELLDLYVVSRKQGKDRPEGLRDVVRRLRTLGFAREHGGFPSYTLGALPDDQADSSWESFFARNAPEPAAALPPERFEPALEAWVEGGGIGRMLKELQAKRASRAAAAAAS